MDEENRPAGMPMWVKVLLAMGLLGIISLPVAAIIVIAALTMLGSSLESTFDEVASEVGTEQTEQGR